MLPNGFNMVAVTHVRDSTAASAFRQRCENRGYADERRSIEHVSDLASHDPEIVVAIYASSGGTSRQIGMTRPHCFPLAKSHRCQPSSGTRQHHWTGVGGMTSQHGTQARLHRKPANRFISLWFLNPVFFSRSVPPFSSRDGAPSRPKAGVPLGSVNASWRARRWKCFSFFTDRFVAAILQREAVLFRNTSGGSGCFHCVGERGGDEVPAKDTVLSVALGARLLCRALPL